MPKKLRFKRTLFLFAYIWYRCVFSLSLSIDVSLYGRNIVFCDLQMYYFKNETTLRK